MEDSKTVLLKIYHSAGLFSVWQQKAMSTAVDNEQAQCSCKSVFYKITNYSIKPSFPEEDFSSNISLLQSIVMYLI